MGGHSARIHRASAVRARAYAARKTRARAACCLRHVACGREIEHDNKATGKSEAVSGVCESSSRFRAWRFTARGSERERERRSAGLPTRDAESRCGIAAVLRGSRADYRSRAIAARRGIFREVSVKRECVWFTFRGHRSGGLHDAMFTAKSPLSLLAKGIILRAASPPIGGKVTRENNVE